MKLKGRKVSKNISQAKPLDKDTQEAVDHFYLSTGQPMEIPSESIETLKKTRKLTRKQYNEGRTKLEERQRKADRDTLAKLPKKLRDKATKDLNNAARQIKESHDAKKYGYKFLEPSPLFGKKKKK